MKASHALDSVHWLQPVEYEIDSKALAGCDIGGFGRGILPPLAKLPSLYQEHAQDILRITFLRRYFVRARLDCESDARGCQERSALAATVVRFASGDWRQPQFQHYCWERGCCEGRSKAAAVDQACALVFDIIFAKLNTKVPSVSRWHTFRERVEIQALGMLLHSIMPRVLCRAFQPQGGAEELMDPLDDLQVDVSAWRVYATRKMNQSNAFMADETSPMRLSLAAVASEPLDALSARVQHLDKVGSSVSEVVKPYGGIVCDAQTHLLAALERLGFWTAVWAP